MKKLVAFYSRADENYVNGTIVSLGKGNTEVAAGMIQKLTESDIFRIEQEVPYSARYNECTVQAQKDQKEDARPALKKWIESLDDYDVIYLGYPNYWSTMPMAVFTFLEHYNFDGKIIRPFCTHEGSGLGSSVRDIRKLCPGAKVEEGLAIRGGSVSLSEQEIQKWVQEV